MHDGKMEVNFNEIDILEDEEGHFLVGKDKTRSRTSMLQLKLDNGILSVSGCTVTCSGCNSNEQGACEPQGSNANGYYCSACPGGGCKKSTTCSDNPVQGTLGLQ